MSKAIRKALYDSKQKAGKKSEVCLRISALFPSTIVHVQVPATVLPASLEQCSAAHHNANSNNNINAATRVTARTCIRTTNILTSLHLVDDILRPISLCTY